MKTYAHMWLSIGKFLVDREMFQTNFIEKIKNTFYTQWHSHHPPKFLPFVMLCWKIWYSQTGYRWPYNTTHAHWMLGNEATDAQPEDVVISQ